MVFSKDAVNGCWRWGENSFPIVSSYSNPRRACAARVTVVVSCVCMSVRTRYSGSTRSYKYNERCHRVKRQICGNNKMAFFLKWSYSKVRAGFTYLGRGGHLCCCL